MSSHVDRSPTRPLYVMWMLIFLAGFAVVQYGIGVGLYCLLYGVPSVAEWTTFQVPMYSTTTLWNGRVWYPVLKVGPANLGGQATLRSVDPEKGDVSESKFNIPFPTNGFVVQQDQLWVVSPSVVTRIKGDELTEFKTKSVLNRPTEPFLYDDQLAVVDMRKTGPPRLLVFQEDNWVDIGAVIIPSSFTTSTVAGKTTLVPLPVSTTVTAPLLDFQVISHEGRLHTFLSDATVVAYREGLELAPVSALAPANVANFPDLSNLADWQVVCQIPPGTGLRGKHSWRGTLVSGNPVVINIASAGPNPFQSVSLRAFGHANGEWGTIAEHTTPASLDLIAASDGQRSFIAGQSLMQTLRFLTLTDKALTETSAFLKAPEPPYQAAMVRWIRIYQWVFWIGLLVMALGVSRLMTIYVESEYQFGLATVELASITRRFVARSIDYAAFAGPGYLIAVMFDLTSQEKVEKNIDKFFDMGADGLLRRIILFFMIYMIYALVVLIVTSWTEGRWGVTLGKWICGIRTIGSTLRPCGFARAMVRTLLLLVETLINNALIPVTLIMALTQHRQRVGDLVADTIVIRKPRATTDSETENAFPR